MKKLSFLLIPLAHYPIFFWMMVTMLFLPMFSWDWYNHQSLPLVLRLLGDFSLSIIITYTASLVGYLLSLVGSGISQGWLGLAYISTWLVSYAEVLVIKFFHTRYAVFLLQVVDETSRKEAFEFFLGYFISAKFFIITGVYVSLFIICGWYLHKCNNLQNCRIVKVCGLVVAGSALFCTLAANVIFHDISANVPHGQDSYSRLYSAYQGLLHQRVHYRTVDLNHLEIEVDSCRFTSPKIVLLIGESYIKRHSSLYGYNLPTTPYLSKLDSLFIFNNVITSVNTTTMAIRNMLSLSSVGEAKDWYESPYFMAYFKKSGYHVSFYSNQYPKGAIGVDGSFLDQPLMNEACFDFRNDHSYPYDGELLDHLEQDRSKVAVGDHWLTIVHFMGQHMMSAERYPTSSAYFTSDSINRADLPESKRWEVAHYDNATRYNDEMVARVIDMFHEDEVIFIYLSDHGDEVYDFRDYAGRNFDISCGSDMLHCHYDVPFLIYATPLYRELHPEIIARIRQSLDNPFMTDDLPHLMFDLAGISTPLYNSTKSLIHSSFNKNRKRMIGYDSKYDYDEICK